jgi:hypothetical protein
MLPKGPREGVKPRLVLRAVHRRDYWPDEPMDLAER